MYLYNIICIVVTVNFDAGLITNVIFHLDVSRNVMFMWHISDHYCHDSYIYSLKGLLRVDFKKIN